MFDRKPPIEALFDDFFYGFNLKSKQLEDANNYYLRLEVPGYKEKEILVTSQGRRLNISGKIESKNIFSSKYTSFEESFELPYQALIDNVSAEYNSGILVVTIPKARPAPIEQKNIPIKALNK